MLNAAQIRRLLCQKAKPSAFAEGFLFVSPVRKRTGEKPLILLGFAQFFFTN